MNGVSDSSKGFCSSPGRGSWPCSSCPARMADSVRTEPTDWMGGECPSHTVKCELLGVCHWPTGPVTAKCRTPVGKPLRIRSPIDAQLGDTEVQSEAYILSK